jgi:transposase
MSESVHAPRLARGLENERVWALEDRGHVSGSFERFLLAHGERVVRVATRSMAGERSADCDGGKSDHIDALAVARAALREGIERLPVGHAEEARTLAQTTVIGLAVFS